MSKVRDLHRRWSKDERYRVEYDSLDAEFSLASALIALGRTRASARRSSPSG